MAIHEKIRSVNECFLRKQIKVDFEWLNGCVQFFIEENPNIQIDVLFREAEEQWELSDLCDSGNSCLPNSIFTRKDMHTIDGTFAVQMQSVLDISLPAYDQLQTMQDKELDVGIENPEFTQPTQQQQQNKATKINMKRVLRLELTDGHRSVPAMEYRPIPCLTTKQMPGTKMLIIGPVRCINGVLFLESKNVRILGGEVSSITIENAYENVLRRCLNQPLNPNPNTDYTEAHVREEFRKTFDNIPTTQMVASNRMPAATHSNNFDDFQDDDLLCDVDVDQIASTAITVEPRHNSTENNRQRTVESDILFEDDLDDNDFLHIDAQLEDQQTLEIPQSSITRSVRSERSIPEPQQQPSIADDKYQFKIRGINLVTVKQLNLCSMQDKLRRKHFLIKGEIDSIVEPAKVARDFQWRLGALLRDRFGSGADYQRLKVRFASSVLDKIAGINGRECHDLNALRATQPSIKREIQEILENLANKLQQIDSFIKIEFSADSDVPFVVDIIEPARVLNQILQQKIEHETSVLQ